MSGRLVFFRCVYVGICASERRQQACQRSSASHVTRHSVRLARWRRGWCGVSLRRRMPPSRTLIRSKATLSTSNAAAVPSPRKRAWRRRPAPSLSLSLTRTARLLACLTPTTASPSRTSGALRAPHGRFAHLPCHGLRPCNGAHQVCVAVFGIAVLCAISRLRVVRTR